MSCTEAETRTHQYLEGTVLDYEIVSAVKSPIEDVIRVAGSSAVVEFMRQGKTPKESCKLVIERIRRIKKDLTLL